MRLSDNFTTRSLAIIAVIQPVIAVFSSKAMTVLALIASVIVCWPVLRHRVWSRERIGLSWIILPFLIWTGASMIWSVAPERSLSTLLSMSAMGLSTLFLIWYARSCSDRTANTILGWLAVGLMAALMIMLFEVISGYKLTRLARGLSWDEIIKIGYGGLNITAFMKNGITIGAILVWPVFTWLWIRQFKIGAVAAGILITALIALTHHHTALIAIAAGAVVALACLVSPRLIPRLLVILTAGWILIAPPVIRTLVDHIDLSAASGNTTRLPTSLIGRLVIWDFTTEKTGERPVTGWGLASSRDIPGGNEKVDITYLFENGDELVLFTDFRLPLHPHNQVLQLWLELGGVGAALLALALLIYALKNKFIYSLRMIPAAHCAGFTTIIIFANSSFGLWQNWWIGLLALSAFWHQLLRPAEIPD